MLHIEVAKLELEEIYELIKTCFHISLYIGRIYPWEIFTRIRKFGISVWWNKSPLVQRYIDRAVLSIKPYIRKNQLHKLILIITDSSGISEESLTFEFIGTLNLPLKDIYPSFRLILLKLQLPRSSMFPMLNICKSTTSTSNKISYPMQGYSFHLCCQFINNEKGFYIRKL